MSIKPTSNEVPNSKPTNDHPPVGINHPTTVPGSNRQSEREVAERIGRFYMKTPTPRTIPDDVQEAADAIMAVNDRLYEKLLGLIDVTVTSDDPYGSYEEMCEDIEKNHHMAVFSGGTHPPHFGATPEERQANNIKARAVHDYFGHYGHDVDFTFWGEFQKYHHMKNEYPEFARPLFFTEVVGQTGAAYYLEGGFDNPLFEQKPIMAPFGWERTCYYWCPVEGIER